MSGIKLLLSLTAFVGISLNTAFLSAEESSDRPSLTVEQVIAAYRANFSSLLPVKVSYSLRQIEGVGLIETDRRDLLTQKLLLKTDYPEKAPDFVPQYYFDMLKHMKREAPTKLEHLEYRLKPENVATRLKEHRVRQFLCWSDLDSYHIRWVKGHPDGYSFPNLELGEITPGNLMDSYGKIQMISWSTKNDPPLRFWYGTQNSPPGPGGEVSSKGLHEVASTVSFPPLGRTVRDWSRTHAWSELDEFMSYAPEAYRILTENPSGTPDGMIVMDCYPEYDWDSPPPVRNRIRAWIDPQQGFLPIRLDYSLLSPSGNPRRQVGELTVDEIRSVKGGFYPMKGTKQEFVADPSRDVEKLSKMDRFSFSAPSEGEHEDSFEGELEKLPGWRREWEVVRFEQNHEIPPCTLELTFPIGTVYHNSDTGVWSKTGTP